MTVHDCRRKGLFLRDVNNVQVYFQKIPHVRADIVESGDLPFNCAQVLNIQLNSKITKARSLDLAPVGIFPCISTDFLHLFLISSLNIFPMSTFCSIRASPWLVSWCNRRELRANNRGEASLCYFFSMLGLLSDESRILLLVFSSRRVLLSKSASPVRMHHLRGKFAPAYWLHLRNEENNETGVSALTLVATYYYVIPYNKINVKPENTSSTLRT